MTAKSLLFLVFADFLCLGSDALLFRLVKNVALRMTRACQKNPQDSSEEVCLGFEHWHTLVSRGEVQGSAIPPLSRRDLLDLKTG